MKTQTEPDRTTGKTSVYVFFREQGFYMLEMVNDSEARKNAIFNPGTIRVERLSGEIVYPPQNPL